MPRVVELTGLYSLGQMLLFSFLSFTYKEQMGRPDDEDDGVNKIPGITKTDKSVQVNMIAYRKHTNIHGPESPIIVVQ